MKYSLILFLLMVMGIHAAAQVNYKSHKVENGETVSKILKKYNISESELFRLNPEIKKGLKENMVLIIPTTDSFSGNSNTDFREHKVKRKENLFRISQQYGVSQDEIKKHNKELYSRQVRKGETIRIPVQSVTIVTTTIPTSEKSPEKKTGEHRVEAQETKFGIARAYGITVKELDSLNPSIAGSDNLPLGILLKVPAESSGRTTTVAGEGYTFYEVQPKEGFYRMKVKFGLSEEEIIALNPEAKEGLKEGMIIKVPKLKTIETEYIESKSLNLENKIVNRSIKNVVMFLPFQLPDIEMDSLPKVERKLKDEPMLRIGLDFYAGAILAAEFAKERGIPVRFHIFDTREMEGGTQQLFRRKNVEKPDVVIGPLRQAFVERVAEDLQNDNIPVISPLSNRQSKMFPNFVQSIPPNELLENAMSFYINAKKHGKNLILVSDNTKQGQRQKLQSLFPELILITPKEGSFLRNSDFAGKIAEGKENWVIMESTNAMLVSSGVNILNSLGKTHSIRLFTTDKNEAFDFREVKNMHLANLNFTYPSVNKTYNFDDNAEFLTRYREKHGVLPNRFAVRGFDVTYDALLRLAASEGFFKTSEMIDGETVYVENKFNYQENYRGGYYNTAVYLLRYTKELKLQIVE